MTDEISVVSEPLLEFAGKGRTCDPYEGLSLFGAFGRTNATNHAVVGTSAGVSLWKSFCDWLDGFTACTHEGRLGQLRAWPPYPGFEVAFGRNWGQPIRAYEVDAAKLDVASRTDDPHLRSDSVVQMYLDEIEKLKKVDERPGVVICVVSDDVYERCRPTSSIRVSERVASDVQGLDAKGLRQAAKEQLDDQVLFWPEDNEEVRAATEAFEFSRDFRRQLKAKVMPSELPVQIIREKTLRVDAKIAEGAPGDNPLSDRLWNLSVGLAYKCGQKPWKLAESREGVCYIGIAFKKREEGTVWKGRKSDNACCAAQMFLNSGDGIVFVGEFGPWYSEKNKQFSLNKNSARSLLAGALETWKDEGGPELTEIFLHCSSEISAEEYEGYQEAVGSQVKVVACRIRRERSGPRLYRTGKYPPLRGTLVQRSGRYGLLYSSGFNPMAGTYEGFEAPVPLSIWIQHGDADMKQVAKDVLSLTKLNYNSCNFGSSDPITIEYSKAIGEILLANPGLKESERQFRLNFYM